MSNLEGTRGKKMLSLVGVRLEKGSDNGGDSQWKVCNASSAVNSDIDYEIYDFETSDNNTLEQPSEQPMIIDYFKNEQIVQKIEVSSSTEKILYEEPEPEISNTVFTDLTNLNSEGLGFLPDGDEHLQNREVLEILSQSSYTSDPKESSDCSLKDPDYRDDSSSTSSSSSSSSNSSSSEDSSSSGSSKEDVDDPDQAVAEVEIKKTRKRKAKPTEWKKACAKQLRNSGQSYKTFGKGIEVPRRQIKPACNDTCSHKCSSNFNEEKRMTIFNAYWEIKDIYIYQPLYKRLILNIGIPMVVMGIPIFRIRW
ncbi:uncharacterized protein LOC126742563 [Anthonomus grandis grandis]|uniref:uncharacterized protein LOC126742563 n=1 Tax=Anthonomus grandis grandis TaxID=2921223 RepID=UPI0021661D3A|nr:uncharacterized protein LOC126742563 [Anthonomus grandis grandis]